LAPAATPCPRLQPATRSLQSLKPTAFGRIASTTIGELPFSYGEQSVEL
jgi:hypothetical protein